MSIQKIQVVLITVVLMALALSCGCSSREAVEIPGGLGTPVAKVDGEFITVNELLKHPGASTIVDELIFEKLLNKKAVELGIEITDEMALDKIERYANEAGGRYEFMEEQWALGLDLESIVNFSRLTLLQEKVIEGMVEEPTREKVLEFLEGPYAKELFNRKAEDLGKSPDEITIEDVYDDAMVIYKEVAKRQILQDGTLNEILPREHEVVNLLLLAVMDDPDGAAWAAADPGITAVGDDVKTGNETGVVPGVEEENTGENDADSETNGIGPPD